MTRITNSDIHKKTSSLALERFLADLITINYEAQKNNISSIFHSEVINYADPSEIKSSVRLDTK
ncbi:hypothetical protein DMI65_01485 [Escherichia coli]|nr:hypothetical protein [Escherichia coli]